MATGCEHREEVADLRAQVAAAKKRTETIKRKRDAALAEVERLREALQWYANECSMPDIAIAALGALGESKCGEAMVKEIAQRITMDNPDD